MEQILIIIKGIKNDGTLFEQTFEDEIGEAINYLQDLEEEDEGDEDDGSIDPELGDKE